MSLLFLIQVRALAVIGTPLKWAMLARLPPAIVSPLANWYVGAVARTLVKGGQLVEED